MKPPVAASVFGETHASQISFKNWTGQGSRVLYGGIDGGVSFYSIVQSSWLAQFDIAHSAILIPAHCLFTHASGSNHWGKNIDGYAADGYSKIVILPGGQYVYDAFKPNLTGSGPDVKLVESLISFSNVPVKHLDSNAGMYSRAVETDISYEIGNKSIKYTRNGIPLNLSNNGLVTTTTNTAGIVVTGSTYLTSSNAVYASETLFLARNTSTGTAATFRRYGTFKNVAGTLTIIGTVNSGGSTDEVDGALSGILVDVVVSGTTITPIVQGLAANNINWTCEHKIRQIF